jgi:hypothetical protein
MKPEQLFLRCYAELDKSSNLWVAVCVDLCLAAQGDSFKAARNSLHEQISEYVTDALSGPDKAYAHQLLNRKAPWQQVAKYHYLACLFRAHALRTKFHKLFRETLPLIPCNT